MRLRNKSSRDVVPCSLISGNEMAVDVLSGESERAVSHADNVIYEGNTKPHRHLQQGIVAVLV
jgi:hypothetical protein